MMKQIYAILDVPDGKGTFKAGQHSFNWGTGLAHARVRTRYQMTVDHELPAWVQELHPAKAAHLYRLAINANTKLPKTLIR